VPMSVWAALPCRAARVPDRYLIAAGHTIPTLPL
jgi:hypothetical protein